MFLYFLEFLLSHTFQITEDNIPIDDVLELCKIKSGQCFVTLLGQQLLIILTESLLGGLQGILLHDRSTLLLIGAVFLVIFNPGLEILILKLLVNCVKILCVLLIGNKTLLLGIVFYRLFLFRSRLDTTLLLGFLHFLERITFLLVDPGKSFFQFLFG